MIVVDTNVIAYMMLDGEHTAAAKSAFLKDPEWVSPLLWRSEFRSVLLRYIRSGHLAMGDALRLAEAAEDLLLTDEFEVRTDRVLALAESSGCSSYDCEFMALAEDLDRPLVTSDRQLLTAFAGRAMSIEHFAASS